MGLYLSPIWHTLLPEYRDEFGYMQNLHNGGVSRAIEKGKPWMLDNGMYTEMWTMELWLRELERFQPYREQCLGIVIPDAVGDALTTIKRWNDHGHIPKEMGYPVCFVTQDGVDFGQIPWDELDVLFIGGTDKHKLEGEGEALCREALERGKWIHVGRVNSARRIERFWYADSYDGTTLSIEPSIHNQRKILNAAREATQRKKERRLL